MPTFDIVVTTIFEPAWLAGYLENIAAHGHADEVTIRIIADRKTPASVYAAADDARAKGFAIDCPSLDEQAEYVAKLRLPEGYIPWDSDNRRNIGFLRAWEHGADVLISIDDDNYCRADSDFVARHAVVGSPVGEGARVQVAGGSAWFNICELLRGDQQTAIYARGFPYSQRGAALAQLGPLDAETGARRVAVNAGLWLDDPDVDALSRLVLSPHVDSAIDADVVLAPGTWTPINTQNTSVHRDAMAAYYYVRMGYPLQGMRIDRYGDIWSGYLLERCAEHMGEVVRVGSPVAEHHRTPHNLFKDLYHELAGIVLTEEVLPWLRELRLTGTTYAETYRELADAIAADASTFKGFVWDEGGRDFFAETARCMTTWLDQLETLDGSRS